MRVRKVARLGVLEANGATVKEAQQALDVMTEAAVTGTYEPIVVTFRSESWIGWREPTGWHSRRVGAMGCTMYGDTQRANVERALRCNAARCEWNSAEESSPVLDHVSVSDEDRVDFARWIRFQRTFAAALPILLAMTDKGTADSYAHSVAREHLTLEQAMARIKGSKAA